MGPAANVVYYKDEAGEWRWRAVAPNGEVVATSSEGYERLDGAINGFHALAQIVAHPLVEVEGVAAEKGDGSASG